MKNKQLNSKQRRIIAKYLQAENKKYHETFVEIAENDFPVNNYDFTVPVRVYRNNKFLVQIYLETGGVLRLSINKTSITKTGDWMDGITWDELQEIKNKLGYKDKEAIEFFPANDDLVNVANIRHLFILPEKLPFGFNKHK